MEAVAPQLAFLFNEQRRGAKPRGPGGNGQARGAAAQDADIEIEWMSHGNPRNFLTKMIPLWAKAPSVLPLGCERPRRRYGAAPAGDHETWARRL
jgi:hypothetical protein